MSGKLMLIDQSYDLETRVAIVEGAVLYDFDYEFVQNKLKRGNIYLAEIKRVEPSLQAAFVDYGEEKHGFLAFSEIHPSYYQAEKSLKNKAAQDIEVGSVDEESGIVTHKAPRSVKIQDVIKRGQTVLVQVIKDVRGTKGAAFSTYISLPGRYVVLMPNTEKSGGISRKITAAEDREALKKIVGDLSVPEKMSLLVRTAGIGKRKTEIKKDYEYVMRLWTDIEKKASTATAPSLISEESDLLTRALRDLYGTDIDEILIEGESAYKKARAFMRMFMPSHVKRVTLYEKGNLFQSFGIEDQIAGIYSNTVSLPSGGSVVINVTEALVAIDVNSAKATREKHIEETALKTNIEAATAIARQLRLRDLSGLVVIDFIDMPTHKNTQVEKAFKEAVKNDRARIQIGKISQFGLLEMSRQRLRQSLLESSSASCPYCHGRGQVLSIYAISLNCLHILEKAARVQTGTLMAKGSPKVVAYLLNDKRAVLVELENRYQVSIRLEEDAQLHLEEFILQDNTTPEPTSTPKPKKSRRKKEKTDVPCTEEVLTEKQDIPTAAVEEPMAAVKKKRRSRRHNRVRTQTKTDTSETPTPSLPTETITLEFPEETGKTNWWKKWAGDK